MCENRNNLSIVFWFLTTRQGKTIFKYKRSNWSFKRNGFRRQKAPFNCSEMQNNISSASINYFDRYFNFNNSWVLWLVWWGNHKLYFRAADWLVCVPRAGLESKLETFCCERRQHTNDGNSDKLPFPSITIYIEKCLLTRANLLIMIYILFIIYYYYFLAIFQQRSKLYLVLCIEVRLCDCHNANVDMLKR